VVVVVRIDLPITVECEEKNRLVNSYNYNHLWLCSYFIFLPYCRIGLDKKHGILHSWRYLHTYKLSYCLHT